MQIKAAFFIVMLAVCSHRAFAQSNNELAIHTVLQNQTAHWNEGDIDSFMLGYWNNDSLLFVGRSGPTYGYQTTLQNYKKNYPTIDAMGILSFSNLQLKQLSPDYYFVLGKFHLERNMGNADGYFTLLFKKIKGKWLIVADHSS